MDKRLPPYKERETYKAHRREFLWQILVPIIVVLILVLAASVAVTASPAPSASLWADISTIWLLIPHLFFAFITIIILGGLIYGIAKLIQIIPIYSQQLYNLIRLATQKIKNVADASTKPIFFVEELSARIKSIFK